MLLKTLLSVTVFPGIALLEPTVDILTTKSHALHTMLHIFVISLNRNGRLRSRFPYVFFFKKGKQPQS